MTSVRRTVFDEQLRELQQQLLLMGTMVENAIEKAVGCLQRLDAEGARAVIANDGVINQKRLERWHQFLSDMLG